MWIVNQNQAHKNQNYLDTLIKPKIGKIISILLIFFISIIVTIFIIPATQAQYLPFLQVQQISSTKENNHPYAKLVNRTEKLPGMFTLYRDQQTSKTLMEIQPEQLNKNFLSVITLESGIGEAGLISGIPLKDFVFQLRKHQDKIQFVLPNIKFRSDKLHPQSRLIQRSFSDSVLYSIPIEATHPQTQALLIDLENLLLGDLNLPSLEEYLPYDYSIEHQNSYISDAKVFPLNIELESVYRILNQDNSGYLESVPDSRAFNIRVRYSFSELPTNNGYIPRLADERVGYFITAYQDISNNSRREPFVRYINRWNLEKQIPSAPLSPPLEPITFWIENTVPIEYRDAIREGVLMWNKAFEKAGFIDAIQVRQMPDDSTWDPADVRYNTIRWSTSFESWFEGYGPSRVNPLTGQILDADIILDGGVIRNIKYGNIGGLVLQNQSLAKAFKNKDGKNYNPCVLDIYSRYLDSRKIEAEANLANNNIESIIPKSLQTQFLSSHNSSLSNSHSSEHFCFGWNSSQQLAVGAIAIDVLPKVIPDTKDMEKYVNQYLKHLTAHEVGHTLGLRHNFHGSTMLAPEELNDTNITRTKGLVGSVMDYVSVNLAPQGTTQGDYFPVIVGPYDEWAIEYGYKPSGIASYIGEKGFLQDIANRAVEPELSYAPDEDSYDILDPAANKYDLSSNTLTYSQWQLDNAENIWQKLEKRVPRSDESYGDIRVMFDTVFFYYFRQIWNATLYVGGQSFNRENIKNVDGRLPFEPIPVEKQRQALEILNKYVFSKEALQFSPDLLNKLAPSRWQHWGSPVLIFPLDYPIQDRILLVQQVVLGSLLSDTRLTRLRDSELKTTPDNVLHLPELFDTLQNSIWREVLQPNEKQVKISSMRRSLQREHLNLLISIVLRNRRVPEDARSLAWYELRQLDKDLEKIIKKRGKKMDDYTRAHLEETRARIMKTWNAQLESN
ncbi:zinc-dependent metalloprotease [Okeania sp.]|uniref:zinc-dependent metalloprotease n=1 Tax=Okeania sp. TaxID=3100323 RepID=UPI002B4AEF52|nr:zinc-dependent metalloprotease [Okeania sp.]MEB3341649.1 zinc-dependent metalloprotease [Okeania sp.]